MSYGKRRKSITVLYALFLTLYTAVKRRLTS